MGSNMFFCASRRVHGGRGGNKENGCPSAVAIAPSHVRTTCGGLLDCDCELVIFFPAVEK